MRTVYFVSAVMAGVLLLGSCGQKGSDSQLSAFDGNGSIRQEIDGSISLSLDEAECYSDTEDPSNNTAEWNVLLSKPGRFDVWLSSATIDTSGMKYGKAVQLSIRDKRLEAMPECDKVVLNSPDVSYPYFRADSFIGSLYLQDTGLVSIQVISDKILPKQQGASAGPDTRMLSLFLTPSVR
ncbi:MAG: hypothetical protein MUE32_00180 [Bacteroidales bacterium]|jgi:hypothetical protein|nr:hypothetical protein [Bacteroidales bacterium]